MKIDLENVKTYLAYCQLGFGMGSWASADTAFEAIERCRKIVESDWDSTLVFDGRLSYINVYDYTASDGWYTKGGGPCDKETKEPLPHLFDVSVRFKNSASTIRKRKAAEAAKDQT